MNPSCTISVRKGKKVYCDQSGYPSYVGYMLFKHYNTKELAEKLVSFGDMHYLESTIDSTCYYHRDWGEALLFCYGEEQYNYTFVNGKGWFVNGLVLETYLRGLAVEGVIPSKEIINGK